MAATDWSAKSVTQVASRFKDHVNFIGAWRVGKAAPISPAEAGVVFLIETIEHVAEQHASVYFSTIANLLNSDGVVVFTTPNNENIEAAKVFCPESGAIFHPMQHVHTFDENRLRTALTGRGFRIEEIFVTDLGLSLLHTPKRWLAEKAKRAIALGTQPPHLVAIARKLPV